LQLWYFRFCLANTRQYLKDTNTLLVSQDWITKKVSFLANIKKNLYMTSPWRSMLQDRFTSWNRVVKPQGLSQTRHNDTAIFWELGSTPIRRDIWPKLQSPEPSCTEVDTFHRQAATRYSDWVREEGLSHIPTSHCLSHIGFKQFGVIS
jgi:hypothetical protein